LLHPIKRNTFSLEMAGSPTGHFCT